jgi:hypothetical protein
MKEIEMSFEIEKLNPSTVSKELGNSEKVQVSIGAGESTIRMLKPSGLTGISTFDSIELRNYIYGINGRY